MAAAEIDLRRLLGPGLAAAVALALLLALWVFGGRWVAGKAAQYHQAHAALAAAARQYRNASDDQAVYQQYAAEFRNMNRRGWIGGGSRLSWIESLQHINRELKLPTLRYDLGRRRPTAVPGAELDASRIQLLRTPMHLTIGALHEGDVVNLLHRLSEAGQGLMSTQRCSIRRADDAGRIRFDPDVANLDVDCSLNWFTLELQPQGGSS